MIRISNKAMDEMKRKKLQFTDSFCGIGTLEAEACWAITS
jgi:23S rRNA G2445 N2-methylase RlmL